MSATGLSRHPIDANECLLSGVKRSRRAECPIVAALPPPRPGSASIRSVYADYGTQRQEIAIPPQHGRIKAGRAPAVQKQSVLAPKLIPEETRELAKRNF